MTRSLLVTQRGQIRELRLNRPHCRNAIDPDLAESLLSALDAAEGDEKTRAVLLTGEGPSFCAGADLRTLSMLAGRRESPRRFLTMVSSCFSKLERLEKPTVAAVHGHAVAGGLEMTLCCDLVVAREGTLMGDGHVRNDLLPGGGATLRLPTKVGEPLARWLMLSGALVPAERFLESGFVHSVVEEHRFDAVAFEVTQQLADVDPRTMARLKKLIQRPETDWTGTVSTEMAALEEHWRDSGVAASLARFLEDGPAGLAASAGG